jgi:hypothetical protein
MTYRDPDDPRAFTDPERRYRDHADPMGQTYTDAARRGAWNGGGTVAAIVALALIVVAVIAYALNERSTSTASGPSTTQSAPSTTGQGGPGAAPTEKAQ